jgi:hypothetical protein
MVLSALCRFEGAEGSTDVSSISSESEDIETERDRFVANICMSVG